jgi:superfamily II DNA/RNA helicase
MTAFADLSIDEDIVAQLATKGIEDAFPIQEQTIPISLPGQDVIGQAKTGTGKTFGFGIPVVQRLGKDPEPGVKALIVVPTRELATQVYEDMDLLTGGRSTSVVAIYGGKAYEGQIEQLKAGAQIVVGTPGRLIDLAGQGLLDLSGATEVVLDEADKMLDLGFLADIEKIFQRVAPKRHTQLFSATMPGPIVALARPRRGPHAGEHPPHRLPRPPARQGRGHRPHPAGERPRQDRDLHAHEATGPAARRRAGRPRLLGRRRPRRHGPGAA